MRKRLCEGKFSKVAKRALVRCARWSAARRHGPLHADDASAGPGNLELEPRGKQEFEARLLGAGFGLAIDFPEVIQVAPVVEDEEAVRQFTETLLEEMGYRVLVVDFDPKQNLSQHKLFVKMLELN